MNKRKFTTLAAGVAAALLVSALAFTMVSCGGDEFTQQDVDDAYAAGKAAVAQGITDDALLTFKLIDSSAGYEIDTASDGAGAVKKVVDSKLFYGAGPDDYVTLTNTAIINALKLLADGDTFTIEAATIPGLGEKAWISEIEPAATTADALDAAKIGTLFGATAAVDISAATTPKLNGVTIPKNSILTAGAPVVEATKTLTVNGKLVATSLTVAGTLAGSGIVAGKVIGGQFDGTNNILTSTTGVASKIVSLIGNIDVDTAAPNTKTKAAVTIPAGVDASFKTSLTVAHALTIEPDAQLTIQASTNVDLGTAGSIVLANKLGTTAAAAAKIKFVDAGDSLVKIGAGTTVGAVSNANLLAALNAGTAKGCTSAANVVGKAAGAGTSVLTQIIGGSSGNNTLSGPASGTGNVTINASTAATGE